MRPAEAKGLPRPTASPWVISGAAHALLGGAALFLAFAGTPPGKIETVEMQVIEKPVAAARAQVEPRKTEPLAKAAPKAPPRRVFGVSRRAHTADDSTVGVKPGNTVAKEQDDETLRPEDEEALPAPTEEYLVSEMPALADEVRIPYPAEAKRKGIEGAVVMDILIDDRGQVRDAKLVSGPGAGLDEAALEAVKRFRFRPATVSGKPVTVRIRYAYRFVLER